MQRHSFFLTQGQTTADIDLCQWSDQCNHTIKYLLTKWGPERDWSFWSVSFRRASNSLFEIQYTSKTMSLYNGEGQRERSPSVSNFYHHSLWFRGFQFQYCLRLSWGMSWFWSARWCSGWRQSLRHWSLLKLLRSQYRCFLARQVTSHPLLDDHSRQIMDPWGWQGTLFNQQLSNLLVIANDGVVQTCQLVSIGFHEVWHSPCPQQQLHSVQMASRTCPVQARDALIVLEVYICS